MLEESIKEDILNFWKGLIKFNVQPLTHAHIIHKEGIPPTCIGPIDFRLPDKYSYREYH